MLQRAVCLLRPASHGHASFTKAAICQLYRTAETLAVVARHRNCLCSPGCSHHLRSMPPAAQVRRSSRNLSASKSLTEPTSAVPLHAVQQADAAAVSDMLKPVEAASKEDASRKRKRSKAQSQTITVKTELLNTQSAAQPTGSELHTAADHTHQDEQEVTTTTVNLAVKEEPTDPTGVLNSGSANLLDTDELPASLPTKTRKRKQPKAKAEVKDEKVDAETSTASGFIVPAPGTDVFESASPRKSKQAKAKAAVKTEPAELDQMLHTAPDVEADVPVTDANEAAPARKPRKPRAKAAAKVDIAEVVAALNVTPYRDRIRPNKWVGAHVSMAGGLERAVVRAAAIGANAFAMDTRSKRRWDSPPIDIDRAAAFREACKQYGFGREHILPHGSYLINLATADPDMYVKSYNAFVDELQRCETLGLGLYNFHPGSTCGQCSTEEGMDRIADAINRAHAETESVIIVLENMAGAGHSVGHKFEYLSYIIEKVPNKARVGVCLDTCHLFAGGYDVSTAEAFGQVMTEFEQEVGLKYLKGMHVNDSKAALGSKKDRHENVAKGLIGQECFTYIMNDSRFDGIPLIMETPVQCEGPNLDYKLSLLAGAAVFKGPAEAETGENTDKRDIAWLNSLAKP